MLDPKFIRENTDKVRQNAAERNFNTEFIDKWLEVDKKRASILKELEGLNRRRNEIAEMLKNPAKRTDEIKAEGKEVKEKADILEKTFKEIEVEWTDLLMQIPNMHFDDVPKGKNDEENVTLRTYLEPTKFNFENKDHLTIGTEMDFLDFEAGSKVSGSQFYYLKNDLVRLNYGLINFGLDFFEKKGFTLVETPDMAKSRFYLGTGYAPRGDEAQTYEIKDEDLGLIATAEVTMAGYHADEIIDEKDLPMKFAAISHCFRKEAGAYGKYSKGLYRVHQFTKLEMFVYCKPEDSKKLHEELLAYEEEILQLLKIPYRVLEMCTGDLGGMAARKFDLEAWMPGRGDYGEVTSTSNCTDYQSRNLNIRYRNANGEVDYLHMLNGTAIVLSRFPIAILENFQQADGTIKVPEVLVPFVGKEYLGRK
jgi:seryl-tRNA synthetase